jgi:hypothetical protein
MGPFKSTLRNSSKYQKSEFFKKKDSPDLTKYEYTINILIDMNRSRDSTIIKIAKLLVGVSRKIIVFTFELRQLDRYRTPNSGIFSRFYRRLDKD